jgi:hypothetical protein
MPFLHFQGTEVACAAGKEQKEKGKKKKREKET